MNKLVRINFDWAFYTLYEMCIRINTDISQRWALDFLYHSIGELDAGLGE